MAVIAINIMLINRFILPCSLKGASVIQRSALFLILIIRLNYFAPRFRSAICRIAPLNNFKRRKVTAWFRRDAQVGKLALLLFTADGSVDLLQQFDLL